MVTSLLMLLFAADITPSQPGLAFSQPQITSDGKTALIVFGSEKAIYISKDNGAPVRVADAPGVSLGNHRGPRVAMSTSAIVVTAGVGPADKEFGPNTLRSWRSTDGGATWSAGPDISTPTTGGMGFQAISSDGKKRFVAAWIGPQNGHPTLFVSDSSDGGATWSKQRVLSETVCECCHPTVAIGNDGTVRILFRNSTGGNRDLHLATSTDGQEFKIEKLGQGSWKIDACPMDGGGIAEFNGQVVTLWRREGRLFLARPGEAEQAFATGKNASIALRSDGVYAVWSSAEGIMAKSPGKNPRVLSKSGDYPVISPAGPVIAAWDDHGIIRVAHLDQ